MGDIDYHRLPLNDDFEPTQKPGCFKKRICCNKITVWQLLLSLFVILSATLLVIYFAIMPIFIQRIVNRSDLSLVSVMMRSLTNSTFVVTAQGVISSAGPFSATIIPSTNFSVSYQNIHLGFMSMPRIHAHGGQPTELYITDNVVTISNTSHLIQYASDLLNSAEANWELAGHVDIKFWGIPFYNIKFNKNVTIPGMNGLAGTQVQNFSIPGDAPGQLDVVINCTIYNPSFVSMELGDINFDVVFLNNTIGTVLAKNITLLNGTNYFTMNGLIQPADSAGLQAVNVFVNQYVAGANSVVSVRGVSGTSSSPFWLNNVIQNLQMSTAIAGAQNLTLIYNLTLNDIDMTLPGEAGEDTDSGLVVMSSYVTSGFNSPFPITINFNTISLTANMTAEGQVLGFFSTSTYTVTNQSADSVGFPMENVVFQITNRPGFMNLIESLMLSPTATFTMSGVASASVTTMIGDMVLDNVHLTQELTIAGVNGFFDAVQIESPNDHITAGFEWGFELYLNTLIYNPSSAVMRFSRLSFDILYSGMFIGNGTASNITMLKGENSIVVQGMYIKPQDPALEREFLSKYLQGNNTEVTLVGNAQNIPLVIPAMQKLNVSCIFPGNTQSLLAWVKMSTLLPYPSGELALLNPIKCIVYMSSLSNFSVYKTDWKFFTDAYDVTFDPLFPIYPGVVAITDPMRLKLTWEEFFSVFEGYLFGNHTLIGTGVVGVQIQEYGPVYIDVLQNFTLVGDRL